MVAGLSYVRLKPDTTYKVPMIPEWS